MSQTAPVPALRTRLGAGEALVGVFVKSSAYQVIEVLGRTPLDFVVLDAEHAPFDRNALDLCLLAARATNLPALVRLPNLQADTVLAVLDMGAAGVLAPHVQSARAARDLVAATRYRGGTRGISPSGRAGEYGRVSLADHIESQDGSIAVLCQIEDVPGVDNVADVAAVDGVDCLFIGRADLAVAYDATNMDDPKVVDAAGRICAAGRDADVPIGVFLSNIDEAPAFHDWGARLFVVGSDQAFLRAGADAMAGRFRELVA